MRTLDEILSGYAIYSVPAAKVVIRNYEGKSLTVQKFSIALIAAVFAEARPKDADIDPPMNSYTRATHLGRNGALQELDKNLAALLEEK